MMQDDAEILLSATTCNWEVGGSYDKSVELGYQKEHVFRLQCKERKCAEPRGTEATMQKVKVRKPQSTEAESESSPGKAESESSLSRKGELHRILVDLPLQFTLLIGEASIK